MHSIDIELTSDITHDNLDTRLNAEMPYAHWRGRESEYMGVYTIARFENHNPRLFKFYSFIS